MIINHIKPYSPLGDICRNNLVNLKFSEFDNIGDLMSIDVWIECVKEGGFIDYDGYGYLCTEEKQSNIEIIPSQIDRKSENPKDWIPEWATHIMWYNR